MSPAPHHLDRRSARRLWMHAQRLDTRNPFGGGLDATRLAVEHLGYVQIDTISVVERSHHHILFTRIPHDRREHLDHAQSDQKSVLEYWTHALSYVATRDLPQFLPAMKAHRANPGRWFSGVSPDDLRKLLARIRRDGPISIRDVDDGELTDKDHPWASRKPLKRVLELGFYNGQLAISKRHGMVKTYDLMERHLGDAARIRPATPRQIAAYRLDRALRSQGLISAPSVMYPYQRFSADVAAELERRLKRKDLVAVKFTDAGPVHFVPAELLEAPLPEAEPLVHILSPFDPLIIQRARTSLFFGYDHFFEAYLPKEKRRFGYFGLPVLVGDEIVAVLDLKTDRQAKRLLVQAWHWLPCARPRTHKRQIEEELGRFERFQLGA
jgi:uncharacterized protein YcaQ